MPHIVLLTTNPLRTPAHDVAEDALEHGAHSVTMIQRSPTYILPKEYLVEVRLTFDAVVNTCAC